MVTGSLGTKEGVGVFRMCVCSSNWYCHCLSLPKHAHSLTASNFQKTSPPQTQASAYCGASNVFAALQTKPLGHQELLQQRLYILTSTLEGKILSKDIPSNSVLVKDHTVSNINPKSPLGVRLHRDLVTMSY